MHFKFLCSFFVSFVLFPNVFASSATRDYSALLSSSSCYPVSSPSNPKAKTSYECKNDPGGKIKAHTAPRKEAISRSPRENRDHSSNVL